MPKHENRCMGCGHRKAVNNVPPKQTREIAMRHPTFVVKELIERRKAKAAGRALNRNLSPVQFSGTKAG